MKVFVTHDDHGKIFAIGAAADHRSGVGVHAKPGRRVSTIDAPELEHAGHFARVLAEYEVDVRSAHPRLVRRRP